MAEVDKELAYEALVELLAHQFAYPVKWIDTQDVLLGEMKMERLVEVGPANTLTLMAKRTVASKYKDHDEVLSIRRDLLSCEEDTSVIYFETDHWRSNPVRNIVTERKEGNPDESKKHEDIKEAKEPSKPLLGQIQQPATAGARSNVASNNMKMPDEPISATAVLVGIIGHKLKKDASDIQTHSSIKALAAGRSTLENEIVGCLVSEFGAIPDRAEGIAIAELAGTLQKSFCGALGKQSSSLVEKLCTSKMPGGFNGVTLVRKYLDDRWGLTVGRQDAVLLAAATNPPGARFADWASARDFLDTFATQHLVAAGFNPSAPVGEPPATTQNVSSLPVVVADPAFVKTQETLNRRTLQLYSEALNIDPKAGQRDASEARAEAAELREELRVWNGEHEDAYAAGIRTLFDVEKVRRFDSAWAWAIQDVIAFFHELVNEKRMTEQCIKLRCNRIANRAMTKALDVLRYLCGVCVKETNVEYRRAGDVVASLIQQCENHPGRQFTVHGVTYPQTATDYRLKRKTLSGWALDEESTQLFNDIHRAIYSSGISFANRCVLLTGAGTGSIGSEVLGGLLAGGAKVIVTTSSYSGSRINEFRDLYVQNCVSGSQLVVAPFNQGSQRDIDALVSYIYDAKLLGWDLDAIIPFAAVPERGEIDGINAKAELAHRVMLTNTIRLIGAVKRQKEERGYDTRPAQVILPLSANHGIFGGDGLYAETKLALEALFNKWHSETWHDYLSICGAAIGWTRGTGLMKSSDVLAEAVEKLGIKTFSQSEMATNILALLDARLMETMESSPMYADFNGGLDQVRDFATHMRRVRNAIHEAEDVQAALAAEESVESPATTDDDVCRPRANIQVGFPTLPDTESDLKPLSKLKGMVDLDSIVVIAGFSDLGPWGSSRTRWDMESCGTFSLEGWVEMAWMMGLIKYATHSPWNGVEQPAGWFDVKTGEPIHDSDVESRYGEYILNHSGIRLVEPELWDGYDPDKKQFLQECVLEADLEPFDASEETATAFKRLHGHHCEVIDGKVYIKKGATILIPKAYKFGTNVAGQIPTGFNPSRYGIPDEIIAQVDPITLYTLICTVEALFSAGISDPYEIYKYIHTSEVGNCIGTGVGGVKSAARMYKARTMEKSVTTDVLQETFLNTVAAWINMLLLSSNGPIRTPVGACATAIESLDTGHDLIATGKAKFCLVGGVDDLEEHMAYEFANMKATNHSEKDFHAGREPKEMSRPTAKDRRGFVESHGCGLLVICTAKLALEMGLPVYGIVAFTSTSSDKVGRSVPAPGKGAMAIVRETKGRFPSPLLSLDYRRRQLASRRKQIAELRELNLALLKDELAALDPSDAQGRELCACRAQHIDAEAACQESDAVHRIGSRFWHHHPEIAPLRGALATWGLTADDITVASFHGTSTVKNELNECDILQRQMEQLGRTKGNRVLAVFQKHLTGHPKGAAGAWMLNGCLQSMNTGLVPGNRNADNVDDRLEPLDNIAFLDRSISKTAGDVKAASVFSFGFGQKGTQAVVVHPKYLFAAIEQDEYDRYREKTLRRQRDAAAVFNRRLVTETLFVAKEEPPFKGEMEMSGLIDPNARLAM